jgi:hypothetical protein
LGLKKLALRGHLLDLDLDLDQLAYRHDHHPLGVPLVALLDLR